MRFLAAGLPEGVAAEQFTLRDIRKPLASLMERRAEDPNLFCLDALSQCGAGEA